MVLSASDGEGTDQAPESVQTRRGSLALWRFSVVSWWAQLILTSVAGVTLGFAVSVYETSSRNPFVNGIGLSCVGLMFSIGSLIWTSGYTRLARRIRLKKVPFDGLADTIEKRLIFGTKINLIGSLFALFSAEQIVGFLIARVLSIQGQLAAPMGSATYGAISSAVRPLDIFVVQANTNLLLSQFLSLSSGLWFLERSRKLFTTSTKKT